MSEVREGRRPAARWSVPVGALLVLAYCAIASVQSLVQSKLVQRMSPEFVAFNVFLLAQVFYLLVCRDRKALGMALRQNIRDVLCLNVATAVSWLAILNALVGLEPVVVNAIVIGLAPTCTVLIGLVARHGTRPRTIELVATCGTLATTIFLTAESGGTQHIARFALSLLACVASSIGLAATVVFTKRLGGAGMTIPQVMASRFPMLLLGTLAIMLANNSFGVYSPASIVTFLSLGAVGVILALHLLQMGIARAEPITVALILGSGAIITFLAQFFDTQFHQSLAQFIGIAGFTASIMLAARSSGRH